MPTRRALLAAGPLGAAAVLLGGCDDEPDHGPAGPPDAVTVLTGFNITGQDSFLYVALDKGWYREAGIEVTVRAGAGTGRNLAQVQQKIAQFAVIDLTGGMLEIDKGGPAADFRVFAAIYQRNVSCIMALPRSAIRSPRDLIGKRIGYSEGGVNRTLFPAYAKLAGFADADVRWQVMAPPSIRPALIAGQIDAATEIVVGRPAVEAAAGSSVSMLPYSDVMSDLYGNALAVSSTLARENPDLVRRFRDATLRGLRWTVEHPAEAGKIMAKHNPTYEAGIATAEITQAAPYVGGASELVGGLDQTRLTRSIALVQGIGLIRSGLTFDRIAAMELAPTK